MPHNETEQVSLVSNEDFAQLIAFDTLHFGASRAALLTALRADDPQRVFMTQNSNGAITGYLIAQTRTIGPWVARSIEDSELLLCHALTLPYSAEPMVFISLNIKKP